LPSIFFPKKNKKYIPKSGKMHKTKNSDRSILFALTFFALGREEKERKNRLFHFFLESTLPFREKPRGLGIEKQLLKTLALQVSMNRPIVVAWTNFILAPDPENRFRGCF
jgi:hypothetical protein